MSDSSLPSVAICVATYKRPIFLRDLIESVARADLSGMRALLIVADNDPAASARPVFDDCSQRFGLDMVYVNEKRRGISAVRNRLVAEVRARDIDYLSFIDDDELVDPMWLRQLLVLASATRAAAVEGIQKRVFEPGVPRWVRRSTFWDSTILPTGTPVRHVSTGNLLLRMESLEPFQEPFDSRYGLTGGEDTAFSEELSQRGLLLLACSESVVYERILPSRGNAKWMIRRSFRAGSAYNAISRTANPSLGNVLVRLLKAVARVGQGVLLAMLHLPHGREKVVPDLCTAVRGIGGIVGIIAPQARLFQEYATVHGK